MTEEQLKEGIYDLIEHCKLEGAHYDHIVNNLSDSSWYRERCLGRMVTYEEIRKKLEQLLI
jgi:hypothetical protein